MFAVWPVLRKVSSVLRIAVSGYYGFRNTGDDAILAAVITTLKAMAPGVEIAVFSNAPAETRHCYGVKAVNRWNPFSVCWTLLRSDLLLSGGGGLLQDVTAGGVRSICYYLAVVLLALAQGKPVVYYAQGVGPVRTRIGRWLVRIVSNRVDLITVRDDASREDLLGMGINRPPLVVTADPVLAISTSQLNLAPGRELLQSLRLDHAEQNPDRETCRLGIVVREWYGRDRYKSVVAAVADRMAREGWEVILIPFHYPEDVRACSDVSRLMQEPGLLVCTWQQVETLFGLLGELDLVLAMRLHAIVMASVMRVPCVGISYDPKVERFLELSGQLNAGGCDDLEEDGLYQALSDAYGRRQEITAHLDLVLAHLRQQAWETASLALSVLYARNPRKRRELNRSSGGKVAGEMARSQSGKGRSART